MRREDPAYRGDCPHCGEVVRLTPWDLSFMANGVARLCESCEGRIRVPDDLVNGKDLRAED